MPNRILKESICTSDNIDQLSAFQETVFYRLIVTCDDFGRMDARPKLLAAKLFPLKDIRASQIEDALRALTSAELVDLYTVGGKPFLQMKTWNRHQRVRDSKEKYPGIEKADSAATCGESRQVAANGGLNPIQSISESESKSESKTRTSAEADRNFEKFWFAYPRHEGKQQARKAFDKLRVDDALLGVMVNAITQQKRSQQWSDPRFIPYPATWLNGRRWEDEPVQAADSGKRVSAQDYSQRDYDEEELEKRLGVDL